MNVYNWLCLFGVPSILLGILAYMGAQLRKSKKDRDCMKAGIQALLRARMLDDWEKYSALGYAPLEAKENFENCWLQYHSLGLNGVMDNVHKNFFELPDYPPETGDD